MHGADDLTMMDVAIDGGTIELVEGGIVLTLGPITTLYAAHETALGRAMFRGLMEGFGYMRPQRREGH